MYNDGEIIEINQDYRYAARYDSGYFDYLNEWDVDTWGVFSLSTSQWTTELELDTFGVNNRLREITDHISHSWNRDDLETAIGKALNRAGYNYKFVNLNGGSQSIWAYVVIYWDPKLMFEAKGLIEELSAWYEGEVYSVALEQRDVYKNSRGDTYETWEVVESVSRVIFTDSYKYTLETCQELLGMPELSKAA